MGAQGADIRLEGFVTVWQEIKRRKIRQEGEKRNKRKTKQNKTKGSNNSSVGITAALWFHTVYPSHALLCFALQPFSPNTAPGKSKIKISGRDLFAPTRMSR